METLATDAWRWFVALWPHLTAAAVLAVNVAASAHAILVKRDTRSTIGWVGLIWLSPVFGAIAYVVLGVNRIRSRATQLRAGQTRITHVLEPAVAAPHRLDEAIGPAGAPLRSLATLVGTVTARPLVDGNRIEPLDGGDEAYPLMLAASMEPPGASPWPPTSSTTIPQAGFSPKPSAGPPPGAWRCGC